MVMDIETAWALVPGSRIKKEVNVEMQRVKILRTFRDGKEDLPKGAIMTIPKWLAAQAKDSNKVEFMPDPEPSEAKAVKVEPAKAASARPEEAKPEAKAEPKAEKKEEPKEDPKKSKRA
jgi:hypothetical protein